MRSTIFGAALLAAVAAVPAMAQDRPVSVRFQAMVGDKPFACGQSYEGIGTSRSKVTPQDFRFYVSEIQLVDRDGRSVPVALTQDGKWQFRSVALLDFEDKSGPCFNGTDETRSVVEGNVPAGDYAGLRFTLGVPFALNHNDATLAASPLNLSGLFWSWLGGYKFLRLDMATTGENGFVFHLGSTDCQPATPMTTSGHAAHAGHGGGSAGPANQRPARCDNPNRPEIRFSAFDAAKDVVVVDIAALLARTNVDVNQPGTPLGCLSAPKDQDCAGGMAALGLPYDGNRAVPQTVFRVFRP